MCERGKFIVFEGADGAGTTTQAAKLRARILEEDPNAKVFVGHTPSSRSAGALARKMIKENKLLDWRVMQSLFYADMVDYTDTVIVPHLLNGYHFICDRYYPSTLVYQSSAVVPFYKREAIRRMKFMYYEMFGHGMLPADCDEYYPIMTPDLTIFLDVSYGALGQRVEDRGEAVDAYEGEDRRGKLITLYHWWLNGTFDDSKKANVDGNRSIEDIAEDCYELFEDSLIS